MPKTPVQSESKNKFNPYITKSISKSLLTPCRPIGLSRRRKTPNSTTSSTSDSVADVSSDSINLDTTPVTSRKTDFPLKESRSELVSTRVSEKVRKKKTVSKCLIIDDDEDTESLASLKSNNSSDTAGDTSIMSLDFELTPTNCHRNIAKSENKVQKIESKSKNITKHPSPIAEIENEESQFAVVKQSSLVSSTISENRLDTKPKSSLTEKLDNFTKTQRKTKPLKRSLSMKKSTEEQALHSNRHIIKKCSVQLSPCNVCEESRVKDESLRSPKIKTSEISYLEKRIQEKRKLVEDLKQAEIYKKLHDVGELQQLTATWKKGCISALNDLLPHLKQHGDIDMATLLSNLRVPENLIRLSSNGDLI